MRLVRTLAIASVLAGMCVVSTAAPALLLLLAIAVTLLGRRRRSTRPSVNTALRTITLGTRDEERVG
jgi:MYXO-CTERM domain-containing protein